MVGVNGAGGAIYIRAMSISLVPTGTPMHFRGGKNSSFWFAPDNLSLWFALAFPPLSSGLHGIATLRRCALFSVPCRLCLSVACRPPPPRHSHCHRRSPSPTYRCCKSMRYFGRGCRERQPAPHLAEQSSDAERWGWQVVDGILRPHLQRQCIAVHRRELPSVKRGSPRNTCRFERLFCVSLACPAWATQTKRTPCSGVLQ